MATRLENLKVTKVDFVDEGANPDAHTLIKKNKGEQTVAGNDEKAPNVFQKIVSFIGKAAGMQQSEIDTAMEEIAKGGAVSFAEKFSTVENGKIADEIWDTCYALQSSLCSILYDEDLDSIGKAEAMQKSLDEFQAIMTDCVSKWSGGALASIAKEKNEVTETDVEIMKSAISRLNENIKKAAGMNEPAPTMIESKGEEKEMRIDKSKMTDAEREFYETIEKKYGVDGDAQESTGNSAETKVQEAPVVKSADPAQMSETKQEDGMDDIYKGLHPAVKKEIESLRKFREEAEDRELQTIAKKYEIIGKKPEDLVPTLKSLKSAGGTAYDDMIALLDQTVDTVQKSGVFAEIGKSGHGSNENSAEAKIETIAKGLMEKDASLTYTDAVTKAWESNPELLAEYDEQAGF